MRDATPVSAALTGGWTVIGMGTFELWEKSHPLDVTTHNVAFLALGIVFFFVPVVFFVIGPQVMHFGVRDIVSATYWRAFGKVALRGFCWLGGGAALGIPYFFIMEKLLAI
jgi:hypothetical protein